MTKSEKEEIIAKVLQTRYGKEELRRSIVAGLKAQASGTPVYANEHFSADRLQILAQVILDQKTFGEVPEEWETNPYRWCLGAELDEPEKR